VEAFRMQQGELPWPARGICNPKREIESGEIAATLDIYQMNAKSPIPIHAPS